MMHRQPARRRTINIGIFLPNWIGDVVMATPALRALRAHVGEHARLVGVMRPYVVDVLAGTTWLDDIVVFDKHADDPQLRSWALSRRLQAQQLDTVVLMTNSLRAGIIARLSKVPQRVGYVRYGRGPLLTDRLYPPRAGFKLTPISAVDYYLGLVEKLGVPVTSRCPELATTPLHDKQADHIWRRFGFQPTDTVIALNTGGAYGSAKNWPLEHFTDLALRLVTQHDVKVLVICGPSERDAAAEIEQRAKTPTVKSLSEERLSLGLSKSIIKRCQLLVTTDSGPRHFGAAFGVPTVTLFGPTDPRWSHNYNPRAIDLQRHVPCGPCAKRTCPLGHHQCMQELSVDQAYYASLALLPQDKQRRTAS